MTSFGCPLTNGPIIKLLEQIVVLARTSARTRDITNHAGDVLEAKPCGPYRISVADSLIQRSILPERIVAGEAIPGHRVLHPRPLLERRALVIGRLGGDFLVSPHDRVPIPRSDTRRDIAERKLVFRLRDIVHARVVHDARAVAHAVDPACTADAVGRIRRAADLIVLQADRVADLMSDAPLEELAHERIGEGNRSRPGIDLCRLREVPRLHQ